ncbi:MAG: hypothetical protein AAFY43_07340 [Pseudomonadota bacterium]
MRATIAALILTATPALAAPTCDQVTEMGSLFTDNLVAVQRSMAATGANIIDLEDAGQMTEEVETLLLSEFSELMRTLNANAESLLETYRASGCSNP